MNERILLYSRARGEDKRCPSEVVEGDFRGEGATLIVDDLGPR